MPTCLGSKTNNGRLQTTPASPSRRAQEHADVFNRHLAAKHSQRVGVAQWACVQFLALAIASKCAGKSFQCRRLKASFFISIPLAYRSETRQIPQNIAFTFAFYCYFRLLTALCTAVDDLTRLNVKHTIFSTVFFSYFYGSFCVEQF